MLYEKPLKTFTEFSNDQTTNEYFKQYLLDLNKSQYLTIPYTALKEDVQSQLYWWDTVTRLSFSDEIESLEGYEKEKHSKMQDVLETIMCNLNNQLD